MFKPESVQVIYEAISGNRVGWKKALHCLNERFSDANKADRNQPCVLLIDELDLLLTRNQSVFFITAVYHLFCCPKY